MSLLGHSWSRTLEGAGKLSPFRRDSMVHCSISTRSTPMNPPDSTTETATSPPSQAELEKAAARERLLRAGNLPRKDRIRALREWHEADKKARSAK